MDNPNSRSSHQEKTPSLGGVSFFIALIFGFFFLQKHDLELKSMSLIFGVVILFFVGLKDDLVILSPFTKLGAQIFASCMLLTHPHFQITDFHGFLGIHAISLYITLP
ncbi:MAG: undecaprenyl/decaprenyl-phosphate alpha-N-acetylglucosaminyl 1-phosphate transferase, partial [Lutibacter sp.]